MLQLQGVSNDSLQDLQSMEQSSQDFEECSKGKSRFATDHLLTCKVLQLHKPMQFERE